MNEPKKKLGLGKFLACAACAPFVAFMLVGGGMPEKPSVPTDPKVFVSCEASRKAIASADEKLTSYMDSEAELETDITFGRRAYTSTTFHDQARLLIRREEARERYFQLQKTASEHGC
jgi:hypothetical protein